MPLGAHVIYEIAVTPDLSLRVSEAREGGARMRRSGEKVRSRPYFAPMPAMSFLHPDKKEKLS